MWSGVGLAYLLYMYGIFKKYAQMMEADWVPRAENYEKVSMQAANWW